MVTINGQYAINSNGPHLDPIGFARNYWPHVWYYPKQQEVIWSVVNNKETVVPAGHKLGKDFVSGFIALWTFIAYREVRVITTSVKDDHLRVLWGEIGRYIETSQYPFKVKKGSIEMAPGYEVSLIVNHRDIRKIVNGKECKISYLRGMVSERGEGLAGHHAEHTLLIIDEASGVDHIAHERGGTWAKRVLVIGNPYACPETHFFKKGVTEGDVVMGA